MKTKTTTMKSNRLWAVLATILGVGPCGLPVDIDEFGRDDMFGSGMVVTLARTVGSFTGVCASGGHVSTEPLVVRIYAGDLPTLIADGAAFLDADIGLVPELDVGVSGASRVFVRGPVERLDLRISGAGTFHGLDVASDEAGVDASGKTRVRPSRHP